MRAGLWVVLTLTMLLSGGGASDRPRILVSTDIGGTDPDDFQSMVHLLLYADTFDVEGLVSSPYGPGRREHILEVIDRYASDYPNLRRHSDRYPDPAALRRVVKQGAIEGSTRSGVGQRTAGSDWIVQSARRDDARPLWVLVWGGIDDLAQALHDAPDILPKLRVYFIGGPNKMWSVDAYNYIEQQHPGLWMIEANSTYRGWFVGGNQTGEWENRAFVTTHVAGRGALGSFFATLLNGTVKMGDSPSVAYLLRNTLDDPSRPGWGGRFVPLWDGRKTVFTRLTTERDAAEAFGVVEFALPAPAGMTREHTARMVFDGRIPALAAWEEGRLRFRFSPRDAKVWPYVVHSTFAALDGQSGSFAAVAPPPERTARRSTTHPRWWIDDPDPAAAEGVHAGARSVSRWREEFLRDFAERLRRTQPPAAAGASPRIAWSAELLRRPPEWYASAGARAIADSVLQYQSPQGAWPKNTDLATPPPTPQDVPQPADGLTNTIDNGATTTPMQFLAWVAHATGDGRYRTAFERGLKYLLAAQYRNGGWPQYYPLRDGYYSRITFNDDAMVNVLELLRGVAGGAPPFAFVDRNLRRQADAAIVRGIDVILRTQVTQNGRLTGWCAQHDETTFAPAWARNFEPPSLSGNETVGIVRFLMGIERPSPAVIAAIDGAVAWLESVPVKGRRVEERTDAEGRDRRAVDDPSAETLWARFYELRTNRPIFTGRDRVIRYDFNQIERERRVGYAYYGRWPARLIEEDYPRWRARLGSK